MKSSFEAFLYYSIFIIHYSLFIKKETMNAINNPSLDKSLHFAARIVKLYNYL